MKVGILGGGQLARMIAQAGQPLGLSFMFLSPNSDACAASFGEHICAPYEDETSQKRLANWADVATYEFENIPLSVVESIQRQVSLHPGSSALAIARDRLIEKRRFSSLDIPTAEFAPVDSFANLTDALKKIGLPAFLKTRTQGYDGKGQAFLRDEKGSLKAWERLGKSPCIVESKVEFTRELSIIAVRNQKGEIVYYPISENYHRNRILRLTISRLDDSLQVQANATIKKIMDDLNYVGVMALELFQVKDKLFANELAPRVHNSGHWTIEGAETSQFENHLRAICGLPLGKTKSLQSSAMVNLIGHLPEEEKIRNIPGAIPHYYGKVERPRRKVGHITLINNDSTTEEFNQRLKMLLQMAGEPELAGQNFFDTAPLTQLP